MNEKRLESAKYRRNRTMIRMSGTAEIAAKIRHLLFIIHKVLYYSIV